ncbi:MAG: hypothetical protein ACT4PJ_04975 [Gemmatimonadaceae bacterium]
MSPTPFPEPSSSARSGIDASQTGHARQERAAADDAAGAEREFNRLLEEQSLHAALAFLNARTRHRFTGVYLLHPPMLRNVCLFDRENPTVVCGDDIPLRAAYCAIIESSGAPFSTGNARRDDRLRDHPSRETVVAYCGVPLATAGGLVVGALCHYDWRPRLIPHAEIPLLEQAAAAIVRKLSRDAPRSD